MAVARALVVCIVILGAVETRARGDTVQWVNNTWLWSSFSGSGSTTSTVSSVPSGNDTQEVADALINFGAITPPDTSMLNSSPQPWYDSPSVVKFFGGNPPSAQQQADFENTVLQEIQQTFNLGGLHPKLTIDPSITANHVLSIVSGSQYTGNTDAIGITLVDGSGFGFIDKLKYADSLQDLEWAVAHNVSHELMHAFGVAIHHDQTGQFLDAATASWDLLKNPATTFSPDAINDILGHQYAPNGASGTAGEQTLDGDQELLAPRPVPEPATLTFWGLVGMVVVAHGQRSWTDRAAA
jgi:hypothetical protein